MTAVTDGLPPKEGKEREHAACMLHPGSYTEQLLVRTDIVETVEKGDFSELTSTKSMINSTTEVYSN